MPPDADSPARRPYVVAHVAVSVEGATMGFEPDVDRFYELAGTWREDVTLAGSDTILAQEQALASAPRPGPAEGGPLLAVVDGQARDSGGSLTGALLCAGLLDEVSLLIHPCLAGLQGTRRWHGSAPAPPGALHLLASEAFGDGIVWLRYRLKP